MYTAVIHPDGTYEVFFDLESKAKGKLVEDWDFPKPTIDDPEDKKPEVRHPRSYAFTLSCSHAPTLAAATCALLLGSSVLRFYVAHTCLRDWVDETLIDDPEDKKPEGYDDIPSQVHAAAPSPPLPHDLNAHATRSLRAAIPARACMLSPRPASRWCRLHARG
eukprot:784986-Pleurochrysis_carterae.AAC.3